MLWAMGFIVVFVMGGVTGVNIANPAFDILAQDTYYVVAHFHYVMSLGAAFGLFAALYYWIGKMSGRQYPEWAGRTHFWTQQRQHHLLPDAHARRGGHAAPLH